MLACSQLFSYFDLYYEKLETIECLHIKYFYPLVFKNMSLKKKE